MNNQEFKDNLISVLKSEGLILIPESVGVYAVKYFEKKRQLLTRVMVTPYQVVKWDLLNGVKSIKTVHNMIKDYRIQTSETCVIDGKCYVLTEAIKRINKY